MPETFKSILTPHSFTESYRLSLIYFSNILFLLISTSNSSPSSLLTHLDCHNHLLKEPPVLSLIAYYLYRNSTKTGHKLGFLIFHICIFLICMHEVMGPFSKRSQSPASFLGKVLSRKFFSTPYI